MKRVGVHQKWIRLVSIFLAVTMIGGQPLALAVSGKDHFADVPKSHWAYSSVEEAYMDGAFSGRGGDAASGTGIFAPDEVITYAEFVAMLVKAFYPESIPAAKSGEAWYTPYLKTAHANKILTTATLDHALARANDQINRYDMAEILIKLLNHKNVPLPSEEQLRSVTAKIADWGEISKNQNRAYYVSRAYALGLLSGIDDKGTFQGSAVVTRAVAAVIYSRTASQLSNYEASHYNADGRARTLDDTQLSLPNYAVGFYNSLIEATDNDGVNDYLIEDRYFTPGNTTQLLENDPNLYEVVHATDGAFLLAAKIEGEADSTEVYKNLRTAFDLFEIDHPEVFWLCGHEDFVLLDVYVSRGSPGDITHHIFLRLNDVNNPSVDMRAGYTEQTIRDNSSKMNASIDTIIAGMPEDGAAEKVKYFNQWLTTHNDYSTENPAPMISNRSISALLGSTGTEGPVCVGYSFALKVLCDRTGIPCFVVVGSVGESFHAWNYVQIDGAWYAVDVTWNDPAVVDQNGNRIVKPASGYEKEEYLLAGKNTVNRDGESFEKSHNLAQVKYPLKEVELSSEAYSWN